MFSCFVATAASVHIVNELMLIGDTWLNKLLTYFTSVTSALNLKPVNSLFSCFVGTGSSIISALNLKPVNSVFSCFVAKAASVNSAS